MSSSLRAKFRVIPAILRLVLIVAILITAVHTWGQVPALDGLTPNQGRMGDVVHLTGTNFSPATASNIVYFGTASAIVSSASATNLDVIVPSGAPYAPVFVTVAGLIGQTSGFFLPTFDPLGFKFGPEAFTPVINLPAISAQLGCAAGDLNGDGKPDLVSANSAANSISAYQNINSNGIFSSASFNPPVNLATPNNPYFCLVADVDRDGKLDIVTANNGNGGGSTVSVFRNTTISGNLSSNSFAPRVDFQVAGGPTRVAVGDLDGDGRPDIVAVTAGTDGGISVLRNAGTVGVMGTNSFEPFVHFTTAPASWDVKIVDLDGDGKPDLVSASYDTGTVSMLRNISSAGTITASSFEPKVDLVTPSTMYDVVVGDLDGDGKPEIVASQNSASAVLVYQNNSSIGVLNMAAPVSFATALGAARMALGDVDGDGKPDLAVACGDANALSVLKNTGMNGDIDANTFAPHVDFPCGAAPAGILINDLDGDGRPELVSSSWGANSISILKNLLGPIPPVFLQQPTNVTTIAGTTISFTSVGTSPLPLAYQWFRNDVPLGGATNATLTFPQVGWPQAGSYKVTITNALGSATSSNAQLTIYAHHFDWAAIPSPQAPLVPFTIAITAKDALNQVITNYSGLVNITATVTNFVGTNLNFETGALAPWTPLNVGDQPGPYDLVTYDVNGDGGFSTAFRILANAGTADGITQDVPLLGGMTYNVRADIATDNLTSGNNLDGGTTALTLGGNIVKQFSWGTVNVGKIYRTNLTGSFTAPTNGLYPLTLTFRRGYQEASSLWCLADDIVLKSAATPIALSPMVVNNFTNGIQSGPLTLTDGGANVILRADDGYGHFGNSNPFNVTNSLVPAILVAPASQNALTGDTVVLAVNATGAPTLSYVWRKNSTNIAGATGPSLTLSNVTRFSSGAYSVSVTNSYGFATSSNAQLMVRTPQRLSTQVLSGGTLQVSSSDANGGALTSGDLARFSVQISTNLVDWTNLPVPLIFNNGAFRFSDLIVTNRPIRLYRVIEN